MSIFKFPTSSSLRTDPSIFGDIEIAYDIF